jgi:hypothetical protein
MSFGAVGVSDRYGNFVKRTLSGHAISLSYISNLEKFTNHWIRR